MYLTAELQQDMYPTYWHWHNESWDLAHKTIAVISAINTHTKQMLGILQICGWDLIWWYIPGWAFKKSITFPRSRYGWLPRVRVLASFQAYIFPWLHHSHPHTWFLIVQNGNWQFLCDSCKRYSFFGPWKLVTSTLVFETAFRSRSVSL